MKFNSKRITQFAQLEETATPLQNGNRVDIDPAKYIVYNYKNATYNYKTIMYITNELKSFFLRFSKNFH